MLPVQALRLDLEWPKDNEPYSHSYQDLSDAAFQSFDSASDRPLLIERSAMANLLHELKSPGVATFVFFRSGFLCFTLD